jgi:hypothetical protein
VIVLLRYLHRKLRASSISGHVSTTAGHSVFWRSTNCHTLSLGLSDHSFITRSLKSTKVLSLVGTHFSDSPLGLAKLKTSSCFLLVSEYLKLCQSFCLSQDWAKVRHRLAGKLTSSIESCSIHHWMCCAIYGSGNYSHPAR